MHLSVGGEIEGCPFIFLSNYSPLFVDNRQLSASSCSNVIHCAWSCRKRSLSKVRLKILAAFEKCGQITLPQ